MTHQPSMCSHRNIASDFSGNNVNLPLESFPEVEVLTLSCQGFCMLYVCFTSAFSPLLGFLIFAKAHGLALNYHNRNI